MDQRDLQLQTALQKLNSSNQTSIRTVEKVYDIPVTKIRLRLIGGTIRRGGHEPEQRLSKRQEFFVRLDT